MIPDTVEEILVHEIHHRKVGLPEPQLDVLVVVKVAENCLHPPTQVSLSTFESLQLILRRTQEGFDEVSPDFVYQRSNIGRLVLLVLAKRSERNFFLNFCQPLPGRFDTFLTTVEVGQIIVADIIQFILDHCEAIMSITLHTNQ